MTKDEIAGQANWCVKLIESGQRDRAFGYLFRVSAYNKEVGDALLREILVRRGVDPQTKLN